MKILNLKRVNFKLNETNKTLSSSNEEGETGTLGIFTRIKNDFTPPLIDYEPKVHWDDIQIPAENRIQVKRFRFVICSMSLVALALSMMSRMILNVAISEMVRQPQPGTIDTNTHDLELNEISNGQEVITKPEGTERFDWTQKERNFLLSSFFFSYAPCMLMSGGLADKYGSKILLFSCGFGGFLINLFTPFIAQQSFHLLVCSRILLGFLQGGIIPACYDLFKRWLTLPETSIFAPLVKVSLAAGGFLGSALPGLIKKLGYEWPVIFYVTCIICAIWSLIWLLIATNSPQTNRFVRKDDLEKVKLKQQAAASAAASTPTSISIVFTNSDGKVESEKTIKLENNPVEQNDKTQIPWLLIISHPPVLALGLVKLTYNFGMDFLVLILPSYLQQIHGSSLVTISIITGSASFMQLILTTFIGWAAKVAVQKETFNLSRTTWRKIFQGTANLSMALFYLFFTLAESSLFMVACLVMLISFTWMLGAGGESMVPYDLSCRYPATIMGLVHSFSIMSGIYVPALGSLILGNDGADIILWNRFFLIISCILTIGGIIFILIHKSDPFLPGEKKESKMDDRPKTEKDEH